MKFLIVEPSRLPILILLGSKYSPEDPVFKLYNIVFPVGYPFNILEAFLHSRILATGPALLNLLDFITLTVLGEWYVL